MTPSHCLLSFVFSEAKIQKMEGSIRKLKEHLEKKTCPKPLQYSARANTPADEQFKKDIKSVKEKEERSFVEALTRFHYRRLENQKSKLQKEKAKTRRTDGSVKKHCTESRSKTPSAETDIGSNISGYSYIQSYTIPTISAKHQTSFNEQMAPYTKSTTATANF